MKSIASACALAAAFLLVGAPLVAQVPLTPRALGMGDAYLGIARGQEALWTNPANLALPDSPRWSLTIGHVALAGTTVGPRFEDFYDVVMQDDGDEARRQEVLAMVPDGGMDVDLNAEFPVLSLQIGPFAVGLSAGGFARQRIDRDVLELVLEGYQEGRFNYTTANTGGAHSAYAALSFGYGRMVGPVALGATMRFLEGQELSRYGFSNPRYNIGANEIEIDVFEASSKGDRGFSLDLGASMQPLPNLTVGAVLSNALGTLDWGERFIREVTLTQSDFGDGWEAIEDRFSGSSRPAEPGEIGDDHEVYLPRTVSLGAGYVPWNGGRLGVSYRTTLQEEELGGPWTTAASIGIQQRLVFLGVRAGFATNLDGGSLLTGGLNVGPVEVGVGRISDGPVGERANGWIGTVGLQVRGAMR